MARDGWGAPRIHGELMKLGLDISERTVSRYMAHRPVELDQVKRWIAFLRNHKDVIAAMDFFTVPTATLRVLYGFFVIEHGRRKVLHFNASFNPTAAWVTQQLREASLRRGTQVPNLRSRLDLQCRRHAFCEGDGYKTAPDRLP